jgi:hypothetical protein
MAHPFYHSVSSAKRFGGTPDDYIELHSFMDYTKGFNPDCRHRLFTHNAWGIFLGERVWGKTITRASDGKIVPVRPLLERHVEEDFGFIPTLERCFAQLDPELESRVTMSSYEQAKYNVAIWGGEIADYLPLHQFLDWPMEYLPDSRSVRVLHNTWGVILAERVFGPEFCGIETKFLAETHILYELGELPTLETMLHGIKLEKKWMCKGARALSQELEVVA